MIDRKKSILFIGNFLSSKGINQGVSKDITERLPAPGWKVIFSSACRKKILRLLDMVSIAISRRNKYQIANIEVFSGQAFIFAELLGYIFSQLNKPFVCTMHGGKLADFEAENPVRVHRLLSRAARVVTPSNYLKNHFHKIREDINLIPNGVDLDRYKYRLRGNPEPKLIWLRALHQIYAPTMAVEVLYFLREKFPNISLTMVGPDKGDGSLEKVKALVNEYHLEDAVHIIGGVDKKQVPYWLNQGDIFINTTRYESFGVSVLEAAACGLPIVTTDAGELPYMWEEEVDALVVPVDDAHAMADAIERILTKPKLAGKLSTNARKKAEGYDWSVIMPQWEKLFSELIEEKDVET